MASSSVTHANSLAVAGRNLTGLDGQCRASAVDAFGPPTLGASYAVRHYGSDQAPNDAVTVSVVPVEDSHRALAWITGSGQECGGLTTVGAETVGGLPAALGEVPCDQGTCYVLAVAGPREIVQFAVAISFDSHLTLDTVRSAAAQVLRT